MSLGIITRLQLQTQPLKTGIRPEKTYGLAHLVSVDALQLSPLGFSAELDGAVVLDVHHANHAFSRYRADDHNAISFNISSNYARMRARFGERIRVGCAAENILIECDQDLQADAFARGIRIQTREGATILLHNVRSAPPCAPFTRWALDLSGDNATEPVPTKLQKESLQFLDNGTRGFYCEYSGETQIIRVGDQIALG